MRECAIAARDVQREAARALSQESLANLESVGMQVNELSKEERDRVEEKAQVTFERHYPQIAR